MNTKIPKSRARPEPRTSDDDLFPPQTTRLAEINALTEMYRGVVAPGSAVYVSAPITSGKRLSDWLSAGGHRDLSPDQYRDEHAEKVVAPNRAAVRALVRSVKEQLRCAVIDPTAVGHIDGWRQGDYRSAWARIIEEYARVVVFADGWEFSSGCSYEFLVAAKAGLETLDESLQPITPTMGIALIRDAVDNLATRGLAVGFLQAVFEELASAAELPASNDASPLPVPEDALKDTILDLLSSHGNVAQFVSFSPDLQLRHWRLTECPSLASTTSVRRVVSLVLESSPSKSVNVRSFDPRSPKGREFIYGLTDVESASREVERLARQGLYTIVNETIDIKDGGVSGVALGDVIEFAPDDTPRCVEKPGVASFPRGLGLSLLSRVYGFAPVLPIGRWRTEFSLHPTPRGYRGGHTILWELEPAVSPSKVTDVRWPNRFSRFLGDKLFGLLIADSLGFPVPRTHAICRNVAPFSFGRFTGSGETWLRTCPLESVPGKFTTLRGWADPFKVMLEEDPDASLIAAVICQEGVQVTFSGAAICGANGQTLVEGVAGPGVDFMLGAQGPEPIPVGTVEAVSKAVARLARAVGGGIKVEWAQDQETVWILQLHRLSSDSGADVVVDGYASNYVTFDTQTHSLDDLRQLVEDARRTQMGIVLKGNVGVTSHFGDVLRRSGVPSRIERG